MATHSNILAWRIPWTEEPLGNSLQCRKEWYLTEATKHKHKKSNKIYSYKKNWKKIALTRTAFYSLTSTFSSLTVLKL